LIIYHYSSLTFLSLILMLALAACSGVKEKTNEPSARQSVFLGCAGYKAKPNYYGCFGNQLSQFIKKNFNNDVAKKNGVVGRVNSNISFDINAEGKLENIDVKSPHPAVSQEIKRVMSLYPTIKPGLNEGDNVAIRLNSPFSFVIQ